MPLTDNEKREIYTTHQIPITNQIRKIEALSVRGASHREIEVVAQCLHDSLDQLRITLGMPFIPADVDPSIYGENADK